MTKLFTKVRFQNSMITIIMLKEASDKELKIT